MQTKPSAINRTVDLFGWPNHYQGSNDMQPTPPPSTAPATRIVLEVYSAHFATAYGRPPVLTPKTRAIAKQLASAVSVEDARTAIANAFSDPWFVNQAGGEISAIYGQINKWLNTTQGKVATKPPPQSTTRRTGLPDY